MWEEKTKIDVSEIGCENVTWSETGSGACQMAYSDTDFNINHVQP
jgi:hypothetical protein